MIRQIFGNRFSEPWTPTAAQEFARFGRGVTMTPLTIPKPKRTPTPAIVMMSAAAEVRSAMTSEFGRLRPIRVVPPRLVENPVTM